jgi:glycerophosphoryl diester phosphodiesterase
MSSELWGKRPLQFRPPQSDSGVVEGMHPLESPAHHEPETRLPLPVIVGHRGAPAYRPEHTSASFALAIDLGADLIEPDIVVSADGVLVVRHDRELSLTTDVADHPEFATRRRTKLVHGRRHTDWFVEDFTVAELRTLRAVERLPELRPLNTMYDGRFGVLTLAEVVELARQRSTPSRQIRVLAELKDPGMACAQGLSMTDLVADELRRLDAATADGTVIVQTFDPAALRRLRAELGDDGPTMYQLVGDGPEGDPLLTQVGLREISTYAQGIAPSRNRLILRDAQQRMTGTSDLVDRAHSAGLTVTPWTLRAENSFLPLQLRRGEEPAGLGDALAEARLLIRLGVDGLITDSPDIAQRVRAVEGPHCPPPLAGSRRAPAAGPGRGTAPFL